MKKIIYMFVAALGLVSCSQDDILDNTVSNAGIRATLPAQSRIFLDSGDLRWEAGDEFATFQTYTKQGQGKKSSGKAYKLDATYANATSAIFNPVEELAKDYKVKYAVYPTALNPQYNGDGTTKVKVINWDTMEKAEKDSLDGTFTITLPGGEGNLGVDAPMFGISYDGRIIFQLTTGMIKIDLSQAKLFTSLIKEVTISTKDYALTGDAIIENVVEDVTIADPIANYYVKPIVKAGNNVLKVSTKCAVDNAIYVPIPAATYPEIVISMTDGTNEIKKTFTNVEILKGWIYNVLKDGFYASGDVAGSFGQGDTSDWTK